MARKQKSKIVRRKKNVRKQTIKNTKEPRTWKQRFFILIVSIFVGGIGYVFLCSDLLKVYKFDVRGYNRVSESQIIEIIEQNMDGKIISCIKKNNYFFINKSKIIEDILKDNRLESAHITKKFPDKIIVEIKEYGNVTVWCTDIEMKTCFMLDGDTVGRQVMMEDEVITDNKHFVIVDETQHDISVGDRVMAEEYLKKIEILGSELKYALNVKIEQPFKVTSRGSHEVRFMTDEGWYIIIDLTRSPDEILDVAKLFVKKVELPSRRSNLEYIDMRFPEKIFYKMKDSVEQVEGGEGIEEDKSEESDEN